MCLIWAAAMVIGARGEAASVIYLCGLSYLFVNITNLYTSIFRAFEKMELELLVSFLKNAVFLPAAIWALINNMGLIAVFSIFLASNLLALAAANFIFVKETASPGSFKLDFGFLKNQLIQTSPLWLSQLFGVTYLKVAPLLLFRFSGEEAVGLYNAGFVVVDGFWIMAGCFVYSVFPALSGLTDRGQIRKEYLARAKAMMLIFSALAAGVFLSAGGLIPLFYGQRFSEVAPLVRVLLVASMLVALDTYNSMTIIAVRRQFLLPFINAAGLAANFAFNILLIPAFSYTGSAYALIASESVVAACMGALLFAEMRK
jgi:O-antigen/teichoic acid export membrane protein